VVALGEAASSLLDETTAVVAVLILKYKKLRAQTMVLLVFIPAAAGPILSHNITMEPFALRAIPVASTT
jgi:hypothetical protein